MPAPAPVLPKRSSGGNHTVLKDLSGKHPVSAIMEVCSKRRWNAPDFVLVQSQGPAHHCSFMFKVKKHFVFETALLLPNLFKTKYCIARGP